MAVSKHVRAELVSLLSREPWCTEELMKELPLKWEKHGDLILLPEKSFCSKIWLQNPHIFEIACKLLQCNRLARRVGPTQNDDFRSPKVQMLHGTSTLVTKKENGILYSWDLSICMFSSGNISEKQRIASWDLTDKTVIDLFAGIGYFTLTYLVHSKAKLVYACEWNPQAVEALKNNLKLNKISRERSIVLDGDNRVMCPKNVADHVNLGLIPSSEISWIVACAALKKCVGGVLHVHGNVDTKQLIELSENEFLSTSLAHSNWASQVAFKMKEIFVNLYQDQIWETCVKNVVKIKSYAPHVDHLVADIVCTPCFKD